MEELEAEFWKLLYLKMGFSTGLLEPVAWHSSDTVYLSFVMEFFWEQKTVKNW